MEDEIFKEEQEHLSEVYGRLSAAEAALEAQIGSLNREAAEDRQDMLSNLRVDNADDEVLLESYGEIETWNHYIDSYNVRSDVMTDRLRQVRILLNSPYFARVTLRFGEDEEPEDYYIGRAAYSENGTDSVIIDWRAPVAETYYSQENGQTSYEVDGRRIPVELLLRRQYDITRDQLNAYFDTTVAIEDPLLLRSLSRRHSNRLQDITTTIQKEQNAIIRHPDVPVLLVNGIAGSGKTSVMLQRIAYLFYQKRKNLQPENIYLMTLNPIFREYIDGVLPDLGERSPQMLTWMEFLRMVHVPIDDPGLDTKAEDLNRIDEELSSLRLTAEDLLPIVQGEETVLSREDVLEVLRRYDEKNPVGVRLIQVTADALAEEAKAVLRKRDKKRREEDEEDGYGSFNSDGESGPNDSQGDTDDVRNAGGSRGASRREENRIESRYGGALGMIRDCGWLDIGHIGRRLLGKKRITSIEWLYLRMALTGECNRMARYICIDEVQDYTRAQLLTLSRYFLHAHFLLLGDEFQAIREGTASFAQIHALFEGEGRRVVELPLQTSYRSTPEITELFASLLPDEKRLHANSVQREGTAARIIAAPTHEEYEAELSRAIAASQRENDGLTAVICESRRSLKSLQKLPCAADLPVVSGQNLLPESGVFLIPLRYAKGLEFDRVILPDADAAHYPDDTLSRHRLYTAISRAIGQVTILSNGALSPLLEDGSKEQ